MTTGRVTFSTLMDLCVSVALRAQVTMCGFSDDLSSRFVCLKKKKVKFSLYFPSGFGAYV